jgi:hypothetical protein
MLPPSLHGEGYLGKLLWLSPRPDAPRRGKGNPRYHHRAADTWPSKIEIQWRHVINSCE